MDNYLNAAFFYSLLFALSVLSQIVVERKYFDIEHAEQLSKVKSRIWAGVAITATIITLTIF
ncbi:hypothetical protein SAMN05192545_3949 [Maribacter dokdonensis]|uniref:Uncharacterized protein n=1 Tax=Maribacter dokdonensis TaxID=320912 RepID=A0ABY0V0S5_9FLAO|nr:hypothetical protein SAMN05192545_3897 [Maribacter dokdonensis]SDT47783.1 hypothetical protein SAMN05192545_3949 [Maribacter dokdonensis]